MTTSQKIPKSVMTTAWILVIGAIAPLLDSTMMNIAVNNLVTEMHSSVSVVQWTITGFVLATSVAVPFSSFLLNRFDGKAVFLAGEIGFVLGSILSALAPTVTLLIGARLVQGFAAGLIMPLLTTLLVQTAGQAVMGQMMATVGLPMILGPILGPVIGGMIIQVANWRWIFWVNVPVGLLAVLLIIWKMPHFPAQDLTARMDSLGVALLATASSAIIYGMVQVAKTANFTNQTTVVFVSLGVGLLLGYLAWALWRGDQAVVPLRLLGHPSFDGSVMGLFLAGTVLNGAMLLLPLFFQDVRHMSVLMAGLALIPQGVGMLLARPLTGRLTDRLGAKWVVIVSVGITIIGTLPFYWINRQTSLWIISLVLFIRGIGAGGILTPLLADSYTGMQGAEVPAATIGARIIQNIGSAFGSALVATIVTATIHARVHRLEQQLTAGAIRGSAAHVAGVVARQGAAIKLAAFQQGFLWVTVAALVLLLPAMLLTNHRQT